MKWRYVRVLNIQLYREHLFFLRLAYFLLHCKFLFSFSTEGRWRKLIASNFQLTVCKRMNCIFAYIYYILHYHQPTFILINSVHSQKRKPIFIESIHVFDCYIFAKVKFYDPSNFRLKITFYIYKTLFSLNEDLEQKYIKFLTDKFLPKA